MFSSNPVSTLTIVLRNADKIGATLPKPVATEHEKLAALTTAADALDLKANLAGAVLTALENGNDPMTDPGVQREATRSSLANTRTAIDDALAARTREFINTHAEAILEAMRKPFDAAAKTLTDAHAELGDVALNDTHAILAKRGNAASLWARAKDAEAVISNVHQTWGVLGGAARGIGYEPMYRLLVIADVDPGRWLDEGLRNSGLTAWDAVRAGHRLDYATPDAYRERMQAIQQERQRRQAHAAGETARLYQATHGIRQLR